MEKVKKGTLSIIIPVFNEKNSIKKIIEKIEKANTGDFKKEIIIVDDCSTDGSKEIIKKLKGNFVKIFFEKNNGKGAALKAGINAASGYLIIFQDADLEYDPNDYYSLMKPILENKTSICFGSRFVGRKFRLFSKDPTMHPLHWVGNNFLTFAFNFLYSTNLTDAEPCYKMFKSDVLKQISVTADRFEYDIELMCKLAKKREKIYQIPINYNARGFDEGKKINWKDGIKAFFTMVKFRF